MKAYRTWVVTTGLGDTVYVCKPDWSVCVSFSCLFTPTPLQDVSQLELTVQMSKQNDTRPRQVLLVLGLDKIVHLQLQAPGVPLQLAYVSYPQPQAEATPWEGHAW